MDLKKKVSKLNLLFYTRRVIPVKFDVSYYANVKIYMKEWCMDWIQLVNEEIQNWKLVKTIINIRVP